MLAAASLKGNTEQLSPAPQLYAPVSLQTRTMSSCNCRCCSGVQRPVSPSASARSRCHRSGLGQLADLRLPVLVTERRENKKPEQGQQLHEVCTCGFRKVPQYSSSMT